MRTGIILLAIAFVLFLGVCAVCWATEPVQVTGIKVVPLCEDVIAVAWSTNKDCACTVSMCYNDNKCLATDTEPERGKLHMILLPAAAKYIQIIVDGNVIYNVDTLE